MKSEKNTQNLLKISELAKASGVSVSTVKYYVRENLIPIAKKTKHNMAYYHPDCIARVRLIKSLQKNRYYPLAVIKRLLEQGEPDQAEIELYDAIHKAERTTVYHPLTLSAVIRHSGLTREQINQLQSMAVITPIEINGRRMFRDSDLRIMQLVKRRLAAGLPFDQTLHAFTAYEKALNEAVQNDIHSVIEDVLVPECPPTDAIVHMIRVSDETLDEFVSLRRYELNRLHGSRHIEDVAEFSVRLKQFLSAVQSALSDSKLSALCENTLSGEQPKDSGLAAEALGAYASIIHLSEMGLAESIALCSRAHSFFVSLDASSAPDKEQALLLALRLGWLTLAPSVLKGSPHVKQAAADLKQLTDKGKDGASFFALIEQALKGVDNEH
ncbi:MAG: MerR family transcriptional regulator [Caldicoprobacterales bacterium]|jgi:DNA-binding transcriptional MerR regulator